jgi:hypothetical protein
VKLNIQTGVAFRLPAERAALVKAVVEAASDFKNETNWIEWKSTVALDKAVGGFVVGKAVLGFANREPSRVANTCEGTAYLIVGAEAVVARQSSHVPIAVARTTQYFCAPCPAGDRTVSRTGVAGDFVVVVCSLAIASLPFLQGCSSPSVIGFESTRDGGYGFHCKSGAFG